jgi:hypothetical protein
LDKAEKLATSKHTSLFLPAASDEENSGASFSPPVTKIEMKKVLIEK